MSNAHENTPNQGRPRWVGPAVIALILVLVAVAGWTIRTLTAPDDPPATTDPSTSTAPAPAAQRPETEAAAGAGEFAWDCQQDLNHDAVSVQRRAPEVQEWVAAGYNVIPFSPQFGGCHKLDSGLRVGYAHSEAGALIAAATYAMALDPSMSEEAADNIEVAIADGPNRDRLAEKAQRIRDGVEEGDDGTTSASSTLIGYSQNHYSNEAASYQLIYSLPSENGLTVKASVQADVVWEDGDWKLDPASGTELMTADQYQGQSYVEWGPKN